MPGWKEKISKGVSSQMALQASSTGGTRADITACSPMHRKDYAISTKAGLIVFSDVNHLYLNIKPFWNRNPHYKAKSAFIKAKVYESLMHSHLESFPGR